MQTERQTGGAEPQPGNCEIPLAEIEAIASDPRTQRAYERRLGTRLYPLIFQCLTDETFDPDHARLLWDQVTEHKARLTQTLGENPGITFATLDYFSSWLSVTGSGKG